LAGIYVLSLESNVVGIFIGMADSSGGILRPHDKVMWIFTSGPLELWYQLMSGSVTAWMPFIPQVGLSEKGQTFVQELN
jgi:hypothetical protein